MDINIISVYIDEEGKIIEGNFDEIEQKIIGGETNILNVARKLVNEQKKVLLIDKDNSPHVSAIALKENIKKEDIIGNKPYKCSAGYDIVWQPESILRTIPSYEWVIVVNWLLK